MNYIQEKLIPRKYYEKLSKKLSSANGSKIHIRYKISDVYICNNEHYYNAPLILIKN